MSLRHVMCWFTTAFAAFLAVGTSVPSASAVPCVKLLEKLGGIDCIPIGAGAQTFITYFNEGSKLLLNIGYGVCTLWVVISGIQIMLAGGDSGKRGEAMTRMTWSIGGLVLLVMSGFVLQALNSLFFT